MQHRASKLLRWWLLLFIILAIIIAAVELMSWNFLKPVIAERIEAATGRSAAIHGDVEVSLFPSPQLSLHDLEIDNPKWASSPHMLEAERVTVSPSLRELLQGEVVLEDFKFSGSTLNLEQRADAPSNWAFGEEQTDPQTQTKEAPSSPLDLSNLSITDSEVRYWAADADTALDVSVSSLQMQVEDETLHTQATLTFQQQQFELEADTDPIEAFIDEAQAFGGNFSISSGDSLLTSTFEVPQAPSLERFQADSKLNLNNLAEWTRWLGLPQVELDNLEIAAQLERQGSEWRLHGIDAATSESQLSGELAMDTAGETPSLDGQLQAPQLDVTALRAVLQVPEEQAGLSVPVLPDLRGDVSVSVGRLILKEAQLENVQTQVQFAKHSIALESLMFDVADGKIEAKASLTSSPERVAAQAKLSLQNLDLTELNSALPAGGTLNADLDVELRPLEQRPTFELDTLLAHLRIGNARFAYHNAETGSDLQGTLETDGEAEPPGLLLNVNGSFRNKPLELHARGAPLHRLVDLDDVSLQQDYPLDLEATSSDLFVQADTTLASVLEPQTLEADMLLDANSGRALEAWIGPVLPPLPDFRLAGRLNRDHQQWNATGLEGEIGSSNISGRLKVLTTERPEVDLVINAGRINLSELIAAANQEPDGSTQEDSFLAPLRTFDGELELTASTLVLPNGLELGELVLNADLEEGRLQMNPLQLHLGNGSLTADLALDVTQSAASGHLNIAFSDMALTMLGDTFSPIEERLGRVSGELHMEMSEALPGNRRDNLLLPFIGRLMFEPSELRFSDPQAGTDLTLNFETQGTAAGSQTFHMQGEGRYDGAPASLSLQGDPLLNARDPNRSYAVDIDADIVDTQISLDGTLQRPLALEGLNLSLALEGPNPQRLSRLLGIALPELPAYSVSGELDLEDQRWVFTDMQGLIGGSNLNGRLALNTNVTPPHVSGALSSTHLDIEDLGFLTGATPEEIEDDDRFVLPDTEIITDAWQGVSAHVSYQGESVRAGNVPLSNVDIDFILEDGRGQFEPVGFGVGEGSVDLTLDLDATTNPPSGTLQVEVQRVDLDDALSNWELADDSIGIIGGRGKLWIEGASIAELLASADGGVVLLMNGGRLDAMLVEIAGLDAGQTFLSWVRDRNPIPIDCAYADFQMRDGVTQLDTFMVDTGDTTFSAGGQVNLNTERLDITIIAHPKDPSVFVGRSPLHLGGTFDNVEAGVHRGELLMRAGTSAALAALAGPLTALLPLVDVGAGPNVEYCQGLISRSREALQEGGE